MAIQTEAVATGGSNHDLLRKCIEHDVRYVIRLKNNWNFRITLSVSGRLSDQLEVDSNLEIKLSRATVINDSELLDADVKIGERGKTHVLYRLIGIPTPLGYCLYLTNLSHETHEPLHIGDLYRMRWESKSTTKSIKLAHRWTESQPRNRLVFEF